MSPYREQWTRRETREATQAWHGAFLILAGAISMACLVVAILYAARWQ